MIDNRVTNLSRREADIALRMFRPTQLELVAKRLRDVPLGLFAHRDYLAQFGEPQRLDDIAGHTLIGFDQDPSWLAMLRQLRLKVEDFGFRTDSLMAQIHAIDSATGIGGAQVAIAERYPAWQRVLPQVPLPPLELWLVSHSDVRKDPAVRCVLGELECFLSAAGTNPDPSGRE